MLLPYVESTGQLMAFSRRLWTELVIDRPGDISAHGGFVRQTKCRGCVRMDLLCPSSGRGVSFLWSLVIYIIGSGITQWLLLHPGFLP